MEAEWLTSLSQICDQVWREDKKAVLLSQVPVRLRQAGIDMPAILNGQKLLPFLKTNAEARFKIVQSETNDIIWGLLPATAALTKPYDQYLLMDKNPHCDRFLSSVWKAFTSAVPEGTRRWLYIEGSVFFRDLAASDQPNNGLEIATKFITLPDVTEGSYGDVVHNIKKWAQSADIDINDLLSVSKGPQKKRKPFLAPSKKPNSELMNSLAILINSLHPSELSRMSIPLDILKRAMERGDDI